MDPSLLLVFIVIVRIGGSGEMVITARNKQENSVNTQSATESIVVVAECGEQLGDNLGLRAAAMQLLVTSDKYRGSRTLPPILLQGANSAREPSKPELDCNQVWLHMIYFSQPSTNRLRRSTLSCCMKSLCSVTKVRNC